MLTAMLLLLAEVVSWPTQGCTREPCCGGPMAAEVDRLPIKDLIEWPLAAGDPKEVAVRVGRWNAAIEAFAATHRRQRGVAALRTTGITIEGSRNHTLLVTRDGRLRVGYDNRDDDWGDKGILMCDATNLRVSAARRVDPPPAAPPAIATGLVVLRFEVSPDAKCTLGTEFPLTEVTERELMAECSSR